MCQVCPSVIMPWQSWWCVNSFSTSPFAKWQRYEERTSLAQYLIHKTAKFSGPKVNAQKSCFSLVHVSEIMCQFCPSVITPWQSWLCVNSFSSAPLAKWQHYEERTSLAQYLKHNSKTLWAQSEFLNFSDQRCILA